MRLYFIRHAQSTNNLLWDQTKDDKNRSEDPGLSEYGYQQAEQVAHFLAHYNNLPLNTHNSIDQFDLTHLYSSPMRRALDTANPIAKTLNLTPFIWEDLHETGGIWQWNESTGKPIGQPGHNRTFFETHYPNFILPGYWNDEGWWNRPFEQHHDAVKRAERFVATLKEKHGNTDDRVAVIGHGAFCNYTLGALLNLPVTFPATTLWFSLHNTSISRIDFKGELIRIAYQNRVDFIPRELLT